MATVPSRRQKRNLNERRFFLAMLVICALLPFITFAGFYGQAYVAYWNYTPQEGDILFQSLPHSRLVNAIEGATESPYSHCGIAANLNGEWVVYEAFRNVEATPLKEFIFRGRSQGFAVYRFKNDYQQYVPATIENAKAYLGRPYDVRYRMDEERIYCTELIYKAFSQSSGQELGKLVRLGELNWHPYEATIKHFEGGPVPFDRLMITPKDMALANQLELVFAHRIDVGDR